MTTNPREEKDKTMEHEAHHGHHHPHSTGISWLDKSLGISAFLISLISLWLGIHSASSMDKLVAANSFPYLEPTRSNQMFENMPGLDRPRGTVEYEFVNNGVGPAMIEWVELSYKGKPVLNYDELMAACCSNVKQNLTGFNIRGSVVGTLVPANKSFKMTSWPEPIGENENWRQLHSQMNNIAVSVCYCSVFNECFIRKPGMTRPEPVKQCKANPNMFTPTFVKLN